MGTRKVPPSTAPLEERIQLEVPYRLWYVARFPLDRMGGKLDKDPSEAPWLHGLYDDIRRTGAFRNPVIVWNHHSHRLTGKQPEWLLRAGSNRVWCAEQLGWKDVPAIVTTTGEIPPHESVVEPIWPRDIPWYFKDPGVIWANDHGIGLIGVDRPEHTYAEWRETWVNDGLTATNKYNRGRLINPMKDDA
jgi:hypothetical protein